MNAEKGSLLAIVLCILFYVLYSNYLSHKYPKAKTTPSPTATTPDDTAGNNRTDTPSLRNAPIVVPDDYRELSRKDQQFTNDVVSYQFDQRRGGFTSIILRRYYTSDAVDAPSVNLLDNVLRIQGTVDPRTAQGTSHLQARREGRTLLTWYQQANWLITHEFGFPDEGYGVDIKLKFKNLSDRDQELTAALLFSENINYDQQPSSLIPVIASERPQIVSLINDNLDWLDLEEYCTEGQFRNRNISLDLLGIDRHYFISTLIPKFDNTSVKGTVVDDDQHSCHLSLVAEQRQGLVAAREQLSIPLRAYFGPKVLEELNTYDEKLEDTLDFGWFAFISLPLLSMIKWLYSYIANYGIAIILLTIFIKMLFYPLTKKSAVSMQRMKELQPQMNHIRETYKDDRQRQQQEIMKFMLANKVNPLKGCLPILPQIPVFFAFYRVLSTSIELRHAPFFFWITDLSSADPYYVSPLLLGACMFLQQKLTPMTGMDKNQQKIMMLMPIIFTVMMLSLPSGMVIYMLTNTIVSIAQQQWLNKRLANKPELGVV